MWTARQSKHRSRADVPCRICVWVNKQVNLLFITLRITDQFGLQLILAVSVTQPPVAALAPCEELPASRDASAVGPSGGDVHHLHPPQGLDDTGAVTGAAEVEMHSDN